MSRPHLATIPPHVPFLDTLARRWLDTADGDPSQGLLLLPTRRAARALAESFLHVAGGRPMLLPRIVALGAIDETPLALAGAFDLPPVVEPLTRLAALSRLVMALPAAHGGVAGADRAWALAAELADLMDEAEQAEIPLADALARAADGAYAEHWEATLRFLAIVTEAWPAWLAGNGACNPAARQVAALDAQAAAWRAEPPPGRVWAAGLTGAIPAAARLLRTVAALEHGCVVLPWLDTDLDDETLAETHPQAGLHDLLAALGATPGDVVLWDGPAFAPVRRAEALGEALLPAGLLHRWQAALAPDTTGLFQLAAADQQEEAAAIALVLRDALATPGARAALVTPDRDLAGRVATELLRWGVVADDSAGESLAETPPAVFLRLLVRAWVEELAPVPLLALLKHPLAAAGWSPAGCRDAARALERRALRGPRPAPGFVGLRRALGQGGPPEAAALVEQARECLEPLLGAFARPHAYPPAEMLAGLIRAAEALAGTDAEPGTARLWAAEEGQALSDLLAAALPALTLLPEQPPAVLPGLLDALLAGAVVRSRRALRGRAEAQEHPRVFIWGLLEARLQAVDVMVLGGLVEGVWPPATDPGPWLSRPMRARAGLPGADRRIGETAHDFVMAACAAPVAVLSAARRRDGAPAVPARWLARLDARLGAGLPRHPATHWARLLDQPAGGRAAPVAAPHPSPPVALRPRKLSVTDIETLIADPYAIYAKRILRLRKLDPLEQETDALDYGTLVHRGIELFLRDHAADWPRDPARALGIAMLAALEERAARPAVAAWWAPRLLRIAGWVAAEDGRRRSRSMPQRIVAEHRGEWSLPGVGAGFTITAEADRIEVLADGTLAILDYKTGAPPSRMQLHEGTAPQLPLEAAMAEAGAFPTIAGTVSELAYWHLTGGHEPGCVKAPLQTAQELADMITDAPGHVAALLRVFDDPAHPYPHCPHPARAPRQHDYAQLARAGERAAARDDS